jgi:hypothetical protein
MVIFLKIATKVYKSSQKVKSLPLIRITFIEKRYLCIAKHQKHEAKKHFRAYFLLLRTGCSGTDRRNKIHTRKHP